MRGEGAMSRSKCGLFKDYLVGDKEYLCGDFLETGVIHHHTA